LNGRQKIAILVPVLVLALVMVGDRVWPLGQGHAALAERYPDRPRICVFILWNFGPEGARQSRVYFVPPDSGKRLQAMVVTQTENDAEVRESRWAFAGAALFWLLMIGGGIREAKRMDRRPEPPER